MCRLKQTLRHAASLSVTPLFLPPLFSFDQGSDRFVLPLLRAACQQTPITATTAARKYLFVYQIFGSKIDPRQQCGSSMLGGAWIIDPATYHVEERVLPELHFWGLVSNREGSELYGLSYGSAGTLLESSWFESTLKTHRLYESEFSIQIIGG